MGLVNPLTQATRPVQGTRKKRPPLIFPFSPQRLPTSVPPSLAPARSGTATMASDKSESKTEKNNGQGQQDESAVYSGELTPLQKHAAFFDRDKDGLIYPSETYRGMRAIGAGVPLSIFAAAFINGTLGPITKPGKFPSLCFPIYVRNIKKGKHGSDSGAYDTEGRFVPEKFEEIFKTHAKTSPHALTSEELEEMLKGNREPKNIAGWIGAFAEWKILYLLGKDKNGFLEKEVVRGVYDGSLFLQLEERTYSKKV